MEDFLQDLGAGTLAAHIIGTESTSSSNPTIATSSSDSITSDSQDADLSVSSSDISESTSLTSLGSRNSSTITGQSTPDIGDEAHGLLKSTSIESNASDVVALMDEERANAHAHYMAQFIPLVDTIARLSEEKERWDAERNAWEDRRRVLEYEKDTLHKALEEEKQRAVEEQLRATDEQKAWKVRLEGQEKKLDILWRKRDEERWQYVSDIKIKDEAYEERVRQIEARGVEERMELQKTLDAKEVEWDTERHQIDQTCKGSQWQLSTERDKLTVANVELAEARSELSKVVKQNIELQEKLTNLERDLRQRDERFNDAAYRWKGELEAERTKREEDVQQGSQDAERLQEQVKTLEAKITHSASVEVAYKAEMDVLKLEKQQADANLIKAQDNLRQERIRADGAEKMAKDAKREGHDAKARHNHQLNELTCRHKTECDEANELITKHRTLLSETEARDTQLRLELEDSLKVMENLLQKAKEKQERMNRDLRSVRSQLADSERNGGVMATKLGLQQARNATMEQEAQRLQGIVAAGNLKSERLVQEMAVSQEEARITTQTLTDDTNRKLSTLQVEIDSVKHSLENAQKTIETHETTALQFVIQRAQLDNKLKAVNLSFDSYKEEFAIERTKLEDAYSLLLTEKDNAEKKLKSTTAELESLKNAAVGFVIARVKLLNDHKRALEAKTRETAAAKQTLEDEHQKAFEVELTRHQAETEALRDAHQESLRGLHQAMSEAAGRAFTTVFETFNAT